jgi:hypothetical protein
MIARTVVLFLATSCLGGCSLLVGPVVGRLSDDYLAGDADVADEAGGSAFGPVDASGSWVETGAEAAAVDAAPETSVVEAAVFSTPVVVQSAISAPASQGTVVTVTLPSVSADDTLLVFCGGDTNPIASLSDGANSFSLIGSSAALSGSGVWLYAATRVAGGSPTIEAVFSVPAVHFIVVVELSTAFVDTWSGFVSGTGTLATSLSTAPRYSGDLLVVFGVFDYGVTSPGVDYQTIATSSNGNYFAESGLSLGAGVSVTATADDHNGPWLLGVVAVRSLADAGG